MAQVIIRRTSSALTLFAATAFFGLAAWANGAPGQTTNPHRYLPAKANDAIYHKHWIDLNKNGREDPYENPALSPSARAKDLLNRMTLAEKIGQLEQAPLPSALTPAMAQELKAGEWGSVLGYSGSGQANIALRNKIQQIAVEKSRLGIPLIMGFDVIHGFRTEFPIPLAMSCSWDPALVEACQHIAAHEAYAAGLDWAFSPMIDIARDARWGRIAEGNGVDPLLDSQMAAAAVRGFQASGRFAACLKHYVGYGNVEGGRDYSQTDMSRFTLRNYYLPPFGAAVKAGALTLMSAFNAIGGVPSSGNHFTLTDVLRRQWHFKGFVVSDWQSISQMQAWGYAHSRPQAAREAIHAGVDMEMVSQTYLTLAAQVKSGKVPLRWINRAVEHILYVKFKLGLFDHPYRNPAHEPGSYLTSPDRKAALRAAEESCVLLQNAHQTLPLHASTLKNVALIGPYADDQTDMLGCWIGAGRPADAVTIASGLRDALPKACTLAVLSGKSLSRAVAAAKNADAVIVTLGEPATWCGEDHSVLSLRLIRSQRRLFSALIKTGKPIIVLLFNGRPLAIPTLAKKASALLECWYPGVEAGPAVANILLGKFDPCGHLTTDFPYATGQEPLYYNHPNTGRPLGNPVGEWTSNMYVDGPAYPLYPFGYGLSYTHFEFGPAKADSTGLQPHARLTITTRVTNTGKVGGTAVVQLYMQAPASSAGVRACRQLAGFKRVTLPAGASKKVKFTLSQHDLGFWSTRGKWTVSPGQYNLWIAPYSGMEMFWCTPDAGKPELTFTVR